MEARVGAPSPKSSTRETHWAWGWASTRPPARSRARVRKERGVGSFMVGVLELFALLLWDPEVDTT